MQDIEKACKHGAAMGQELMFYGLLRLQEIHPTAQILTERCWHHTRNCHKMGTDTRRLGSGCRSRRDTLCF